jgi:hypothetical protein
MQPHGRPAVRRPNENRSVGGSDRERPHSEGDAGCGGWKTRNRLPLALRGERAHTAALVADERDSRPADGRDGKDGAARLDRRTEPRVEERVAQEILSLLGRFESSRLESER